MPAQARGVSDLTVTGSAGSWQDTSAPGTGNLASLFTGDATYLQSPYEQPITGLDAIKQMWEERKGWP